MDFLRLPRHTRRPATAFGPDTRLGIGAPRIACERVTIVQYSVSTWSSFLFCATFTWPRFFAPRGGSESNTPTGDRGPRMAVMAMT